MQMGTVGSEGMGANSRCRLLWAAYPCVVKDVHADAVHERSDEAAQGGSVDSLWSALPGGLA